MSLRRLATPALAVLLVAAVAVSPGPARAGSLTFEIQFDNTKDGLTLGPGGELDIQLNPNMKPASPTVTANFFGPNPIADVGAIDPGNTTGSYGDLSKPGGVTMSNALALNEQAQFFTVTSFFDVFVTLSGPEIGQGATGPFTGTVLTFTLYDAAGKPAAATLVVNPNVDSHGNPIVDGTVKYQVQPTGVLVTLVPEPSGGLLLGLGAVAVGAWRCRRTRRHAA
jgi:hypothetical protein